MPVLATTDKPQESGKAAKRASRKGKAREENAPVSTSAASRIVPVEPQEDTIRSWNWSSLAEPQVSSLPPVFTRDGRYFFVPVSSTVKIYSTTTGKVVSTLKSHPRAANGLSDKITCLRINPRNSFQLYTGSADGTLRTWDFVNGALLSTIDLGYPIQHLCVHQEFEDYAFVACKKPSKKQGKDSNYAIMRVSLRTSSASASARIQKPSEIIVAGKVLIAVGIGISASGKWLVVAGGSKIYVASTSKLKAGFTKFICTEKLTCLALHPTEDWLATGDERGQVRLWYCLRDDLILEGASEERTTPTTTWHWHAHAVQAIEFTSNGAYILTGGEESVLIIWQVQTGRREAVPRVGAPIRTITVYDTGDGTRGQEYLLSLSDGSLAFISSSTLKISRIISRVKLDTAYIRPSIPPLAIHPKSGHLFLPSAHPSSLQVYSPLTSTLITEIEVSPSNRISRPHGKPLEPSRVDHVAVSECGKWLATVDTRESNDESFGLEVFLKFWRWMDSEARWDLNTKIDKPHGEHRVHSIAFNPITQDETEIILASTGGDGQAKTWSMQVQTTKISEVSVSWVPRSLLNYRNQMPTQAIWSSDGSILAVAQSSLVTLWSVRTNALYKVLNWAEIHQVKHITFIDRGDRYLCCASLHWVVVYDLIRARTVYIHKSTQQIRGLLAWSQKDTFALVHDASSNLPTSSPPTPPVTTFQFFGLTTNQPIQTRTIPFHARQYMAWRASEPAFAEVVALTQEGGLIRAGDDLSHIEEEGSQAQPLGGGASEPSLFQDIFGQSTLVNLSSAGRNIGTSANRNISHTESIEWGLLDAPSHLLPAVHTLFMPLMESMLLKQENVRPAAAEEEDGSTAVDIMDIEPLEQLNGTHYSRDVTSEEIDAFVDLFRTTAFTTPRATTSPARSSPTRLHQGLTNGKPKINGIPFTNGSPLSPTPLPPNSPLTNGIFPHKSRKTIMQAQQRSPPPVPPSPPPTIGKKRKKAMMS